MITFSLSSFALTPFSLTPLGLTLAADETNEEDDEFEFPPITSPAINDSFIHTYNTRVIIVSGIGTLTGISFIIFGIMDIFGLLEEGYFTHKIGGGLFFFSTGLIISSISITFLKPAINSLH